MVPESGKERCKACYPCPMGVVGCDEDREPHGHGGTRICQECGVPYAYVHPHSKFCSNGTPINMDVVHDEYHMNIQLEWKKSGINIKIRKKEKEIDCNDTDCNDAGTDDKTDSNRHKFLALRLIPKTKVIVGKNHVQSRLHVSNPEEAEKLKNFALLTINNRIEFCKKYKTTEEEIGKCVCESLVRYIRISKDARTKTITRVQINAIKKMFEEMKKDGKIKCQDTL
jgi:hypothetical protein